MPRRKFKTIEEKIEWLQERVALRDARKKLGEDMKKHRKKWYE